MNEETTREMTLEDRMKALLFQFASLYERWSEDRQVAAKQGADMAELVKLFEERVKVFKELEPQVRKHLAISIEKTMRLSTQQVSAEISEAATKSTEKMVQELSHAVRGAKQTLETYQREIKQTQWQVIGVAVVTTIATCLLLVKLVIPDPTLPLDDNQIIDLRGGQIMRAVWPKLSKGEQKHWLDLRDRLEHPSAADDGEVEQSSEQ